MIIEETEEKWLPWYFNVETNIHVFTFCKLFETFCIYKKKVIFARGKEKWYQDGIKRYLTTIRNNNTYIWYKKRIRANVLWNKLNENWKVFFRTFNFLFLSFREKWKCSTHFNISDRYSNIFTMKDRNSTFIDEVTHSSEKSTPVFNCTQLLLFITFFVAIVNQYWNAHQRACLYSIEMKLPLYHKLHSVMSSSFDYSHLHCTYTTSTNSLIVLL